VVGEKGAVFQEFHDLDLGHLIEELEGLGKGNHKVV
jgi:hypothetical protein